MIKFRFFILKCKECSSFSPPVFKIVKRDLIRFYILKRYLESRVRGHDFLNLIYSILVYSKLSKHFEHLQNELTFHYLFGQILKSMTQFPNPPVKNSTNFNLKLLAV